jgi:hypothetical protein
MGLLCPILFQVHWEAVLLDLHTTSKNKDRINTKVWWKKWTLLILLWTDYFALWKSCNDAIHGHDNQSQHQVRCHKLWIKIEYLHSKLDQVLSCDKDVFHGNTLAELTTYLDPANATQMQNWLYTWKPFILSSINQWERSPFAVYNIWRHVFRIFWMALDAPLTTGPITQHDQD